MEQQKINTTQQEVQYKFDFDSFMEEFELSWLAYGVGIVFGEFFLAQWMSGLKYLDIEVNGQVFHVGTLPLFAVLILFSIMGAIIYFLRETGAATEVTELEEEVTELTEDLNTCTLLLQEKEEQLKAVVERARALKKGLDAYKAIGGVQEIQQKLAKDSNTIIEFNKTISLLSKERDVLSEKVVLLNDESNVLLEKHKLLTQKAILLNDDNKVLKEKLSLLEEENSVLKSVEDNIDAEVEKRLNKSKAGLISSLVRKGVDKNLLGVN